MTSQADHFFDTFERRLHGAATPSELSILEEHARACSSCALQLALQPTPAARSQPNSVPASQRMRDERAVNLALSETLSTARRGRRPIGVLVAAAVLGSSVAAAAVANLWRSPFVEQHAAEAAATNPGSDPRAKKSPPALVAEAEPGFAVPDPAPLVAKKPGRAPAATKFPSLEPRPTAAVVFAEANQLRRAGEDARAISAYRRLQEEYRGSCEARQSYVTLGYLLLDSRQAAAALLQFDGYIAGGGSALQDALFGRARALQRLRRQAEERLALQQLVSRFPGSVNAARAQVRLAELQ